MTDLFAKRHIITDDMIDAGGKALRERQMSGRITRDWADLPKGDKKKWRAHAEAVLEAAAQEKAND